MLLAEKVPEKKKSKESGQYASGSILTETLNHL